MRTHYDPSDVTDAQWALIAPHLPPSGSGGRPRETDMRDLLDTIFDLLRTGCQWGYLPGDLPPESIIWRYFDRWRRDGTLDRIHEFLRRKVRARGEAVPPPDDRQRRKPVRRHDLRRRAAGPRQRQERRRAETPIVVESMGLLLAVLVAAALVDDAAAAPVLFARLGGQPMGKVTRRFAGSESHNFTLNEWVDEHAKWDLQVIRRPEGMRGWVKLPIRGTAERMFAWLGRCRRLSEDRESLVLSSESLLKLAMIQVMFHRLEPSNMAPECRYPRPVAA